MVLQLSQHLADQLRPRGGVGTQVVYEHNRQAPRARDRATAARIWAQKTSAVRPGASQPSHQPSPQSTSPKP